MIHLEMTPATSDIRAYLDQPNGYADRAPYRAKLTVMHLSDTLVYLQGAVGVVDRETWRAAFDLLRARGVTNVMVERRGRMRTIEI
ncbi:MAG: hypothetical protein M3Y65_20575 [Pseudomonadota bacterium]|nr:hypothetical protein [Pseudomonadota bacterium]